MLKPLATLLLAVLLCATDATAQMPMPQPPQVSARQYLLMDAATGRVLAERDADAPVEPASLTKLMTAYVAFKAIAEGRIGLEDPVTISREAWIAGGGVPGSRERRNVSTMYARERSEVSVDELLHGMIVVSGNDASVALAERVAGSESAFAGLMNHYASQLGMVNSNFVNSHGLSEEGHISSAADMARLAQAIVNEFPDFYRYYSERSYTWDGISQPNRNGLLGMQVGANAVVDGMKTGFTNAAQYCLVTSAAAGEMRLISVVLGAPSVSGRERANRELLSYGFNNFETHVLYRAGDAVTTARLWRGAESEAALGVKSDVRLLVPRGQRDRLHAELDLPAALTAPVSAADEVGRLDIQLDGERLARIPLYPLVDGPRGTLWQRARDSVLLWLE
jgi:serine-type D-Ala-D-Ala carboxypeptidase (penicillin-binding protein 5/6)